MEQDNRNENHTNLFNIPGNINDKGRGRSCGLEVGDIQRECSESVEDKKGIDE